MSRRCAAAAAAAAASRIFTTGHNVQPVRAEAVHELQGGLRRRRPAWRRLGLGVQREAAGEEEDEPTPRGPEERTETREIGDRVIMLADWNVLFRLNTV